MTESEPERHARSVHQRIKNEAAKRGRLFNEVLQAYVLERFLFRLSISPHADTFVLKGALLLHVWGLVELRPTRDIDLLGHGPRDATHVGGLLADICRVECSPDGLVFDPTSIRTSAIAEDAEYEGIRVDLLAHLGPARLYVQVDVGFGDMVTPRPIRLTYPTVLDMDSPTLLTYPPETAVAEKTQVMFRRGVLNSRVKDYFDIWALARSRSFDGEVLAEALRATCERRSTDVPT